MPVIVRLHPTSVQLLQAVNELPLDKRVYFVKKCLAEGCISALDKNKETNALKRYEYLYLTTQSICKFLLKYNIIDSYHINTRKIMINQKIFPNTVVSITFNLIHNEHKHMFSFYVNDRLKKQR
jgi:hypothetical protein